MHDRSFIDDPTRAFRGVRLGERLRFKLEARTARWMLDAIRAGLVDRLSARRLYREVALLFEEPATSRMARALERRELLAAIHPCLSLDGGRLDKLRRLDRALSWYGKNDRRPTPVRWVAALGSLTVGAPADSRRALIARLKPNRRESGALFEVAREAPRMLTRLTRSRRLAASRVRETCDGAAIETLLVALAAADGAIARALRSYLDVWRDVRLDIDGSDLLRAGLVPGPAVARGLTAALRAKLDGRAPDGRRQLAVALRGARRA
jgi:tRNA nucleotidyltransferase (CCA-adding enzyme)